MTRRLDLMSCDEIYDLRMLPHYDYDYDLNELRISGSIYATTFSLLFLPSYLEDLRLHLISSPLLILACYKEIKITASLTLI